MRNVSLKRAGLIAVLVLALAPLAVAPLAAQAPPTGAPKPKVQPPVQAPGAKAKGAVGSEAEIVEPKARTLDHSAFDALLKAHVVNGLVDYAAFRNNAQFTQYLAQLNSANLKGLEEPEIVAFWLNVYNAYTIQLVVSHNETQSIRNIEKTLGFLQLKGPWSVPIVKAAGRTLSLDEVEHRVLRHDFSEPRIHFAMSFAAKSAPALRSEAYTGERLDEQLEDQARLFLVRSPDKVRIDTTRNTVFASPIITRYRDDFGASNVELGRFLADYYPDGPERRLLRPRTMRFRRSGAQISDAETKDTSKAKDTVKNAPKPAVNTAGADSAAAKSNEEVRIVSRFRLRETPFDWTLNIQTSSPKKP